MIYNADIHLQLTDIDWLRPPSISGTAKMSKTDEAKRRKLLAEFIYWLFDSFIIQLLRAQFYITESSAESNRVFYFRHDVWKKISEPQLEKLKLDMFQMVPNTRKKQVINAALDITQFRLTPKEHGVRIIMNLGKKKLKEVYSSHF